MDLPGIKDSLLDIANLSLNSSQSIVREVGGSIYRSLFRQAEEDPHLRQRIISSLVTHIGSKQVSLSISVIFPATILLGLPNLDHIFRFCQAGEVESSLGLLLATVEDDPGIFIVLNLFLTPRAHSHESILYTVGTQPFNAFIKTIIDHLEDLDRSQTRTVYTILAILETSPVGDIVQQFITKKLSRSHSLSTLFYSGDSVPVHRDVSIRRLLFPVPGKPRSTRFRRRAPDLGPQAAVLPDRIHPHHGDHWWCCSFHSNRFVISLK